MADRSLRGMRIGSQSLQSEEGVVFAERSQFTYRCAHCGTETVMTFATEAETPESWECKHCGQDATLLVNAKPIAHVDTTEKHARSHWDMLLERRTIPELEELLDERLGLLRARRGTDK